MKKPTATYQTQYAVNFSQNGVESDAVGTVLTILGIARLLSTSKPNLGQQRR